MRKIYFTIICLFLVRTYSTAQYYLTGVEPSSTEWRQIKTEKFRIIFPLEAKNTAFRYLDLISSIDTIVPKSLKTKNKPFDIIVHNHSVLSNGFVVWAPKRMEIISIQPTSLYPQKWLTQLALHETRHVSQISTLYRGMIKPFSYLFGQQAIGLAAGFIPNWFLEGDAVTFETVTSNSGRGRQADFYQYYRARFLGNADNFSYDKWLLGSYKDKIPSHYNFGYQIVSYGRIKYGEDLWPSVLTYVTQKPYTIFPFYFGLKKETGLSRKKLFEKTFSNLDSIWKGNLQNQNTTKCLIRENKEYCDYRYPYFLDDTQIIAYKESLSQNSCFVLINTSTKKEEKILGLGYNTSKPSYYKNKIFWTEYTPHPRWEYLNYSLIKKYDIVSRKVEIVSDKGIYLSPVYNPLNDRVYAIEREYDGTSSIIYFQGNSKIKHPFLYFQDDYEPFELFIASDSGLLFVGSITKQGKVILSIDEHYSYKVIFGPTYQDFHSLTADDDFIFYSATDKYADNLFLFNYKNNKLYNVYNSIYGSTDPIYVKDKNQIYFSDFTKNGYLISCLKLDTLNTSITSPLTNDDEITNTLKKKERYNIDSVDIKQRLYTIDKYHGLKTMFNFHSWTPFFFDPNKAINGEIDVKPGFTLLSQNLTGSSVLAAGYGYNKSSMISVNYTYYGFFPVISYKFDLMNYPASLYALKNTQIPSTTDKRVINEIILYVPLTLSANSCITYLMPSVVLTNSNDYLFSTKDSSYHKGLNRFNYSLYITRYMRKAYKDILPRLGFSATVDMLNAPFNHNNIGSLIAGNFNLYLPGFFQNHSILVKTSFQHQALKNFYLSNKVPFPHGYYSARSEDYKFISGNYLLPIVYPDIALGSLVYIKRIFINTFLDYAENSYPVYKSGLRVSNKEYLKSFGVELSTDVHFFRTRYPFRLKYTQGWMGVNLLPFNSFSVLIDFYNQ